MNFQPFTVARYGVYGAALVALLSIWLGREAGGSLDYLLMRAVPIFVIVSALGFGADAVLSIAEPQAVAASTHNDTPGAPAENPSEGTEE
jgi:hypothetical protein